MIQVELVKIIIDEKRQDQIIVLKEKSGERQFPIVIGFLEASSIKMRISGIEAPRPLTHDLLVNVITMLGAKVERLIIDKMVQNTFHGKIELKLKNEQQTILVDTRPSDGIAIAVRAGAPIFVEDEVLEKVALFKQE